MKRNVGTLAVPGTLDQVPVIRSWMEKLLLRWALTEDIIADIQSALTEICTNVVRHGYQTENEDKGEIRLAVVRKLDTIEITVTDDAPAYVPESGAGLPLRRPAEGGYGRFLAESLMDQITHEPLEGVGNRTTLVKRISAKSGEPELNQDRAGGA